MVFQPSLFQTELPKIGVVDLETTGFLKQKGLIVEIGIASLNLNTGKIRKEFSSLVKETGFNSVHRKPPYGWIFHNSTISFEEVDAAPSMTSLFEEVQSVMKKFPVGITAYNAAFDLPFLRSRSFSFKALPCPMIAATPVVNLPPAGKGNTPKWPTVQEAWNFLFGETGYIETHRAMDDAVHEAQIIYELFQRGAYKL